MIFALLAHSVKVSAVEDLRGLPWPIMHPHAWPPLHGSCRHGGATSTTCFRGAATSRQSQTPLKRAVHRLFLSGEQGGHDCAIVHLRVCPFPRRGRSCMHGRAFGTMLCYGKELATSMPASH